MLLNNDRHRRYHEAGPKDVHFGGKDDAVMMVSISRSTIENEQMSIQVPIFANDSREELDLRIGMAASILQDRQDDASEAWKQVNEKASKDRQEETLKRLG